MDAVPRRSKAPEVCHTYRTKFFFKGKRRPVGGERSLMIPALGPSASAPPPAPGHTPDFSSSSSSTPSPGWEVGGVLRTLFLGFKSSIFNVFTHPEKTFCRVFPLLIREGQTPFTMKGRGGTAPGASLCLRTSLYQGPHRRSFRCKKFDGRRGELRVGWGDWP